MGLETTRAIRRSAICFIAASLIAITAQAQVVKNGDVSQIQVFPPDNWWNIDISAAPIDPNSAAYINYIGLTRGLHPDFGGDAATAPQIYGMPFIVVGADQPRVPVTFIWYDDESDSGFPGQQNGYPIPPQAINESKWYEGGFPGTSTEDGDRHMLIIDRDQRLLYELYSLKYSTAMNRWEAGSGIILSLDSNRRRPEGWTSADAAGLAIFPGLVRYDETMSGNPIRHAFRVTVRATNGHVFPASHTAGSTSGALPMGARLRLKASKDISGYTPYVQRIFQAMKTYGLIVADNGSDMYIQGQYDTRWNNSVLNPAFSSLKASDFEVVQLGWQPATQSAVGPLQFHTLTPCRILDTRDPSGRRGGPPLHPSGEQRIVVAKGTCGIPATAKALAANITVVNAGSAAHLRLFPGDQGIPATSVINFRVGQTRANNSIIALSSSGTQTFGLANFASAPIHAIVDVNGYFE